MPNNIELRYTPEGFVPPDASANPRDNITIFNDDSANDITLTFTCESTSDPLTEITSPVTVPSKGGSVAGAVRKPASNHSIVFQANGFECPVSIGPAQYEITVSPTTAAPPEQEANALDQVVISNESTTEGVDLEISCGDVEDPLGSEVGMRPHLPALGQLTGTVQPSTMAKRVKVTVKGPTTATSKINVRSGDSDDTLVAQKG